MAGADKILQVQGIKSTRSIGDNRELWGHPSLKMHTYMHAHPQKQVEKTPVTHEVTALEAPMFLFSPSAWPWPTYPVPNKLFLRPQPEDKSPSLCLSQEDLSKGQARVVTSKLRACPWNIHSPSTGQTMSPPPVPLKYNPTSLQESGGRRSFDFYIGLGSRR